MFPTFSVLFNEIVSAVTDKIPERSYIFSSSLLKTNLEPRVTKCSFQPYNFKILETNLKSLYLDSRDNSLICPEANDSNVVYIPEALFPATVALSNVSFSLC